MRYEAPDSKPACLAIALDYFNKHFNPVLMGLSVKNVNGMACPQCLFPYFLF